jgi:hypothetical protein
MKTYGAGAGFGVVVVLEMPDDYGGDGDGEPIVEFTANDNDDSGGQMRRNSKQERERELAGDAKMFRAWRQWHADQLAEALTGLHRDVMARLMERLKQLRSARELVEFIAETRSCGFAQRSPSFPHCGEARRSIRQTTQPGGRVRVNSERTVS